MNCPGCQRDNHAARRYCGGCGCNFEPACNSCGFANERSDRFCGGCGEPLRTGARHPRPGVAARGAVLDAAPAVVAAPTAASTVWEASELAELFAPPPTAEEEPDLPDAGIGQGDVDRLFGGAS